MFFRPKAKKQLENILVDKYKYSLDKKYSILTSENPNNKLSIRFYRWYSEFQVKIHYDIDETYHDIIWETLDKWAPKLDDRLSLAVLYDDGVEFEFKEDINSVNADYIIYLIDRVVDKFNEIIYNIE